MVMGSKASSLLARARRLNLQDRDWVHFLTIIGDRRSSNRASDGVKPRGDDRTRLSRGGAR
jgi:hypothetical protein